VRGRWSKLGLAVFLLFLLAAFVRALALGLCDIDFGGGGFAPHFTYVSVGEARFWIMHTGLVVPASIALLWLARKRLGRLVQPVISVPEKPNPSQDRALALLWFSGLTLLYRLGRSVCLYDLSLTDDENTARFGGQVLASGRLMVPEFQPPDHFMGRFFFSSDGFVTAADWPGVLSFSALAELANTDVLYAMWSALGGVAVVIASHRCFGRVASITAAIAWLVSPMVFSLSLTTHAHVVSRTLVALAVLSYLRCVAVKDTESGPSTRAAVALGLLVGASFCTRPFETACLFAPIGVHLLVRALKNEPGARPQFVAALVAVAIPLAAFAAYNQAVVGSPWTPPRFSGGAAMDAESAMEVNERLGSHVAFNAMLLGVFFMGGLGLLGALLGLRFAPTPVRVLAAGTGLSFLLMLGHDNIGIHTVGPIHYSESVVALVLLGAGAVDGAAKFFTALGRREEPVYAMAWGYLVVTVGLLCTVPYAMQLKRYGEAMDFPYAFLHQKNVHQAIVLAPPTRFAMPAAGPGTWQHFFPPPSPSFEDDVIFTRYDADPEMLHEAHPDRNIYRLRIEPGRGVTEVDLLRAATP
jgi:hypothetical protein